MTLKILKSKNNTKDSKSKSATNDMTIITRLLLLPDPVIKLARLD